MSLGLTKPGASVALRHPKTGAIIRPLMYRKNGTAVWPVLGAASDDPDDPAYTGDDDDPEDDDEEDDEEEDEDDGKKSKKPASKKSKKSPDDDEDEDDDEEDSRVHRSAQQAKRYRLALRAKEKEYDALSARLQAIEDVDKAPDEVAQRTISELKTKADTLAEQNRIMVAQLAFFQNNTVEWADPLDAFALAERAGLFDEVVDDDGNVDERELRRGLRDLAKRKPHLVKKVENDPKARGRKSKDIDDDEEEDDDEPRSRRTAGTMNGNRKGTPRNASRAALAKKFPVLNQM